MRCQFVLGVRPAGLGEHGEMTPSVPRTPRATEAPTEPGEPSGEPAAERHRTGRAPETMSEPATTAPDTNTIATAPAPWARGSAPDLDETDYRFGEVIGRGGMGEVLLAHDMRIGRDVAIKRMKSRAPSESEIGRFVREARIQARLDHPAIVPVHELGHDRHGNPYFTMRRLTGRNLHALMRDPSVSQQRLLRAFVDVCLALDYA